MLEQFAINTLSTIVAAAVIALVGFLFRNRIRRLLKGVDLRSLNQAPDIEFVDMQYITDINYNNKVLFLIKNCGSIDVSHIRLFKCVMENPGNPTFLAVRKLPYVKQFTSIGQGGETMQVAVDTKFFALDDRYPDVRLFVEMITEDGSCFRATVIRAEAWEDIEFGEGGFFVDHIGRVGRQLPLWTIKASSAAKIKRIEEKYDINLAVG